MVILMIGPPNLVSTGPTHKTQSNHVGLLISKMAESELRQDRGKEEKTTAADLLATIQSFSVLYP